LILPRAGTGGVPRLRHRTISLAGQSITRDWPGAGHRVNCGTPSTGTTSARISSNLCSLAGWADADDVEIPSDTIQ